LRPAVVLAKASIGDWVLCQVTSNGYSDPAAIEITQIDFQSGTLRATSYVRPGKIFTASQRLIVSEVGILTKEAFEEIIEAVVALLKTG